MYNEILADQESFIRQCGSKKYYTSEKTANKVIDRVWRERGTRLRHYPCPFCGWLHLTKLER